jgi:hypothetical protein
MTGTLRCKSCSRSFLPLDEKSRQEEWCWVCQRYGKQKDSPGPRKEVTFDAAPGEGPRLTVRTVTTDKKPKLIGAGAAELGLKVVELLRAEGEKQNG